MIMKRHPEVRRSRIIMLCWSAAIGACGLGGAVQSTAADIYDISITKRLLYGPGPFPDQNLKSGHVNAMHFGAFLSATVPAFNNGGDEPNVSGEKAQGTPVDGKLSDGTKLNENIEMGNAVIINGQFNLLLGAVFGGPAQGASRFFLDDDYNWTIRDDIAMDPGFPEGVVKIYDFTFSTGPKPVPFSIQTASKYPGGLDRVGTLNSGDITIGRLGDDDFDGHVDGVFFAMGQLPLSSAFLPGAPFVQEMEFTSSIPIGAADAALLTVALARNCVRALVEPQPGVTMDRSESKLRDCARERTGVAVKQLRRAAGTDRVCKKNCSDLKTMASELEKLPANLSKSNEQKVSLLTLDRALAGLVRMQGRDLRNSAAVARHGSEASN